MSKIYGIPVATPLNPEKIVPNGVIFHTPQALTEEQKAQARENVGSASVEDTERLTTEIAVERARIDAFTSLGEGSTTGDAELMDIRVGHDGTTYETAGEAVRNQVSSVVEKIDAIENLEEATTTTRYYPDGWVRGRIDSGVYQSNGRMAYSEIYDSANGTAYCDFTKYKFLVIYYDENETFKSYKGWYTEPCDLDPSKGAKYRIQVSTADDSPLTDEAFANIHNAVYVECEAQVGQSLIVKTVQENSVELQDARIGYDGTTYNSAGEAIRSQVKAMRNQAEPLAARMEAIENLESIATRRNSSGWVRGRIESGTHQDRNRAAYSAIFDTFDGKVYCDFSVYKLVVVLYDENENLLKYYGWLTEPYALTPSLGAKYRLQVETLDGSNISDEALLALNETVYVEGEKTTTLVKTVREIAEKKPLAVYVDGATGSDSNHGTESEPFATIQKGIDSGAEIVYVMPGEYTGSLTATNRDSLTIMPTTYASNYSGDIPQTEKIKLTGTQVNITDCGCVNIVGIHSDGSPSHGFQLNRIKSLRVVDCIASNATGDSRCGFKITSSNGTFVNCVAHNIALDGFNMHGYGNTDFFNCSAYDCGDDGISHHDGCTGSIYGGEWYRCGKGGISSPTHGAYTDVFNVYSHDNVYGLYAAGSAENRTTTGKVSGCVFKNNTDKDLYIGGVVLTAWNNIYDTKQVHDTAIFTEFN